MTGKTRSEACNKLAFEWQNILIPEIDNAVKKLRNNMEINHFLACLNNRLAVLIAMKLNVKKDQKKTKKIKVLENWHPTFEDGTVEVTLSKIKPKNWTISVWGDDDFGMVIYHLDINEAYRIYNLITDNITIKQLKKLGFEQA